MINQRNTEIWRDTEVYRQKENKKIEGIERVKDRPSGISSSPPPPINHMVGMTEDGVVFILIETLGVYFFQILGRLEKLRFKKEENYPQNREKVLFTKDSPVTYGDKIKFGNTESASRWTLVLQDVSWVQVLLDFTGKPLCWIFWF